MIKEVTELAQDALGIYMSNLTKILRGFDDLILEVKAALANSINPENKPIEEELDDEEYRGDGNYYGLFGDETHPGDGIDLDDKRPVGS